MKRLATLAGLAGILAATALPVGAKNWETSRLAPRIGVNLPVQQYDGEFTPGFAFAVDYKLSQPRASLDLGFSAYQSQGDNFNSKERIWGRTITDSYDETIWELAVHGGPTFHIRSSNDSSSLFFGGGLRQNFVFRSESAQDSDYRGTSRSTERDALASQLGSYGQIGMDFPLKDGTLVYFRVEPRFTFNDGFTGLSSFIGVDFPLESKR